MLTLLDLPEFIRKKYTGSHVAFYYKSGAEQKSLFIDTYIQKSEAFSVFLASHGIKPKQRILTIMFNSPDWLCIEMGVFFSGAIHVPLSPVTAEDLLENIIESIKPSMIVVNSVVKKKQIEKILLHINLSASVIQIKENNVFPDYTPNTFLKAEVNESDVAVILYTSGSTQSPKGVMLTHRNILTSITEFSSLDIFNHCHKAISLLPFNLSAERKLNYSYLLNGISICFPSQIDSMSKSLQFFKPDITAMVPFMMNKLLSENREQNNLHLQELKVVCGGAPLSQITRDRFTEKGGKIYEVYGLTESTSLLAYNTTNAKKTGTVGQVAKSVKLLLADDHEIWVKGENIMNGYWINEDKVDTCRNAAGWFQTGDIGALDDEGFLIITGRKNNSFKNSKGEFIYPEQIESFLTEHLSLSLCLVFENETGSLSAIFQPDEVTLNEAIAVVLKNYNLNKDDSRKVNQYLIVHPEDLAATTNSLKHDRKCIIEKYKKHPFFYLL